MEEVSCRGFKEVQIQNKNWWENNPMAYCWHDRITFQEGTVEFFEEIDRRFFLASPFYTGEKPFARLIPFENLKHKRVLEIGCGLGSHTQQLVEAGCRLTAIDLTNRAVELTKKRLSLRNFVADVRVMDAEVMDFPDEEFDFVWSWGVIHHSSRPQQIIKEVFRILKNGGEFRLMVYHLKSLSTLYALGRGLISGKLLKMRSITDTLNAYSDGYIAKHYTKDELHHILLSNGFTSVKINILGQTSELLPLPGRGLLGHTKSLILKKIPDSFAEYILTRLGGFLFAIARK